MSNLPQQNPWNQYVADGIEDTYVYSFLILSATSAVNDIAVYVTLSGQDPNPDADIQQINVAYTVTGVGVTGGGTIVFEPGYIPPNGAIISILRNMSVSINTEFVMAQNFSGQNLDNAFERCVLIMQQLNTHFNKLALQYLINSYLPTNEGNILPVLTNIDNQVWISQAGKIIAAVLEEKPDVSALRAQLASQVQDASGSGLVGFYDRDVPEGVTVEKYLNRKLEVPIATGTGDALIVTIDPDYTAYKEGTILNIQIPSPNFTGAPTINVNGIGAEQYYVNHLAASPISVVEGQIAKFVRRNGLWRLCNPNIPKLYGASVSLITAAQVIPNTSTNVIVAPDTVDYDIVPDLWNISTPLFGISYPGYYEFKVIANMVTTATIGVFIFRLLKNGSLIKTMAEQDLSLSATIFNMSSSCILHLTTNDSIQLAAINTGDANVSIVNGVGAFTFQCTYVGG